MVWIKKWDVPSTDGKRQYVVAVKDSGEYGCSCPAWKFRRKQCKHIRRIQAQENAGFSSTKPDVKFNVPKEGKPIAIEVIPFQRVSRAFNFDE